MNEKSIKRRDWVKNVAIIFLVIMLLLTFFSNTIMNYSLPEVATKYVQSGSITSKIRGTGVVEASDPYNVVINESRVVESVSVKKGDVVEKGDVLFVLEDSESEELKSAMDTLEDMENAYNKAVLAAIIAGGNINSIQSASATSITEYMNKVTQAQQAVDTAQQAVDAEKANVAAIQKQIDLLGEESIDTSAEKQALEDAKSELQEQQNEYKKGEILLANYLEIMGGSVEAGENAVAAAKQALEAAKVSGDEAAIANAQAQLDTAQANLDNYTGTSRTLKIINAHIMDLQLRVEQAQQALENKQGETTISDEKSNLNKQLIEAKEKLTFAENALTQAKENQTEVVSLVQSEMDLAIQAEEINDQRALVEELRAKTTDAVITAPVSGTITSVNFVAGEKTTKDAVMAVIQIDEKGFTLSFSVTAEQAKKVSVGDAAEIQNAWYYSDVKAVLASIKPDTSNPKNKLLVFNLSGDVTAGQSLSLSVGQNSANYDLIVPNSAIREDSNGKFILIVESKSTPFGNRYVATRVDIEVLAEDDTQSAISAGLYGYEYVITTSTKPVQAGDQVRLAD